MYKSETSAIVIGVSSRVRKNIYDNNDNNNNNNTYIRGGILAAADKMQYHQTNVACVVSAESGDMTETYGVIETCRRHVGSIGELLIAKRTYIYLHTNSYVAYIRTTYRHKKFVSPRHT